MARSRKPFDGMSSMNALKLAGRILFLSADPRVIEAQLGGADLESSDAGALRDDVSTDEITPVAACIYFDHRLRPYPHTGFKAGHPRPTGADAGRQRGLRVARA